MDWTLAKPLSYWRNYSDTVKRNCFDTSAATTDIGYWQNKLFAQILKYFLPLSLLIVIPGVIWCLSTHRYFLALSQILAVTTIAFISLSRGLSVTARKNIFIITVYFIATVLLSGLGSFGPGRVYLVAAVFFAAMIFTRREGYWSLILNALICVAFGFALRYGMIKPEGDQHSVTSWVTVSINLMFVSVVIFFLQYHLFNKLEESNKRFKIAAKATSETVWEWDLVHDNMYHNEGMLEMFGYKEPEIGEKLDWWEEKIHPGDRERVTLEFNSFLTDKRNTMQVQYRFLCADNSYKHVCNRAAIVLNKNGTPTAMIGAIQDITDMVTHVNDIETKNEKLQQIAWIQSHKVRNHVATILGLSQLLKDPNAHNAEIIKGIVESCKNLDAVIKEINDLSTDIDRPGIGWPGSKRRA